LISQAEALDASSAYDWSYVTATVALEADDEI
jgi:hypothetical protein